MDGEFALGGWKWTAFYGSVAITYKSSGELKHVKAQGKDDSRDTWLGRNTGKVKITISWKQDTVPPTENIDGRGPISSFVHDFLADIDPRGPNGGKPFQFVEDDADISVITSVIIEDLERTKTPGSQLRTATISASTWVKPAPQPAVTATPKKDEPWSPGPKVATFTRQKLPGFGTTPPKVKP